MPPTHQKAGTRQKPNVYRPQLTTGLGADLGPAGDQQPHEGVFVYQSCSGRADGGTFGGRISLVPGELEVLTLPPPNPMPITLNLLAPDPYRLARDAYQIAQLITFFFA